MGRAEEYRAELVARAPDTWPAYLDAHSGLPGPRGNLELAQVVADLVDPALGDALIGSGDEYRTFCGVLALGSRAADPAVLERLRSWRSQVADERGVAAFRVLPDVALEAVAAAMPTEPADLRHVQGLGQTRLREYGDALLRVVADEAPRTR